MISANAIASCVAAHAAAAEKSRDRDLAGVSPQLVATLDFADPLELLKMRIELDVVGNDRQIEHAAAQGPVALVPLGGRAKRIAPRLGRVIERSGIDDRPVQKIVARIMRIFVVVENVGDAEFPDRYHQAIGRLAPGKLVDAGVNLLRLAAEIDGLPDECTVQARVGIVGSHLVGFPTGKAGDAERAAETKSLIDFRIDPEFRAMPQPQAEIGGGVEGLASGVGIEAVLAAIGSAERRRILLREGGLAVDVPDVLGRSDRHRRCVVGRRAGVGELIIQSQPHLLQGKVGIEPLRRRRKGLAAAVRNR